MVLHLYKRSYSLESYYNHGVRKALISVITSVDILIIRRCLFLIRMPFCYSIVLTLTNRKYLVYHTIHLGLLIIMCAPIKLWDEPIEKLQILTGIYNPLRNLMHLELTCYTLHVAKNLKENIFYNYTKTLTGTVFAKTKETIKHY